MFRSIIAGAVAIGLAGCAGMATRSAPQADIVDTAVASGQFKTLVAAVQAADLVDTLKGPGPFTVFAPTDDAFAKLPAGTVETLLQPENKDQLVALLTYHVVPGEVTSDQLAGKTLEVATVEGRKVAVDGTSGVRVNSSTVIAADIAASNGVVHAIDTVLMPSDAPSGAASGKGDIVDTAIAAGSFETLVAAVQAAGLESTLRGEGPFTVFAPTDAAFAKLPEGALEDLLKPENKDQLQAVLTYHVLPGEVYKENVMGRVTSAKTVNGRSVRVNGVDGVRVNDATVTAPNVLASNGVIHVIDTVLLPH